MQPTRGLSVQICRLLFITMIITSLIQEHTHVRTQKRLLCLDGIYLGDSTNSQLLAVYWS